MLEDSFDISNLRRVLVIKLRHHGDVLLSSPVFSVLKNHAPHLEIDALVYKDTAEMLTLHPAISQIQTIDRNWKHQGILTQFQAEWRLLSILKTRHYDLVIHLTDSNRGLLVKLLCGARFGVAPKLPSKGKFWRAGFSHRYPLHHGNTRHTVESNLDALRRIGIYPGLTERALTLIAGVEAEAQVMDLLAMHGLKGGDFIHFHPASRWLFKCWPQKNCVQLIEELQREGHRIVISAAPDPHEIELVAAIINPLACPVINLAGRLTLKQLAALNARAKLFIGMDSAPMHIAAAMRVPTVALFGPSGEKEWGPWMTPHRILLSAHSCRPCGNDGCGGGKRSECLSAIEPDAVVTAVHQLLTSATERNNPE
ncbi:heptosyltransferase III [Gammaproteobacteria bacterium]